MSMSKFSSDLTDLFIAEFYTEKRLETGYSYNQPKWAYWVHPVAYSAKEWGEMDDWVLDTMGYSDWSVEHARWVGSDQKYWFRDEQDRTMFILRWI